MPSLARDGNAEKFPTSTHRLIAETGATIAKSETQNRPDRKRPGGRRTSNRMQKSTTLHPNTRILLDAWRRMAANPDQIAAGPQASAYPELIDCLFVLSKTADGHWVFSNAGDAVNRIVGRSLEGHDFHSLWSGNDRRIMSAVMETTTQEGEPSIVRLAGESLQGFRCDIEVSLAPLASRSGMKMLGLYQSLGGEAMLRGRTVWRHRIISLKMPDRRSSEPRIRLVASND